MPTVWEREVITAYNLHMCGYVNVCVHYVGMFVCSYVYVCMCTVHVSVCEGYVHVCVSVIMCTCACMCVCVCMCVYVCVCACVGGCACRAYKGEQDSSLFQLQKSSNT